MIQLRRLLGLTSLAALLTACGGGSTLPRAQAPELDSGQAKCRVAASRETPLVTEWPASEKANLEVRLREGAVAVAYTGCTMRLLPACRLAGSYRWRRTTTSSDVVEISSADDLYAKLPLGAVSLEGELARTGRLAVQTTVTGQLQLEGMTPDEVPGEGACQDATHLLGALSIGSFKLRSGGTLRGGGTADVATVGTARGGTRSEESLLREAGDAESCKLSTEEAAHAECSSPIQAFLLPLPRLEKERVPTGFVKATFVSGQADHAWEVKANNAFLCKTPCTRFVNPAEAISMRAPDDMTKGGDHVLDVPDLRPFAEQGPLEIRANPRALGMKVTGLALVSIGGSAMFFGGFIALAGSLGERDGMVQGGAIAALVGGIVVLPGIYLMLVSSPSADVYAGGVAHAPKDRLPVPAVGGSF